MDRDGDRQCEELDEVGALPVVHRDEDAEGSRAAQVDHHAVRRREALGDGLMHRVPAPAEDQLEPKSDQGPPTG